jgi:putative transposase
MYRTRRCRIRRKRELWEYSRDICVNSARLYNRANFIVRQYATACRDWEEMRPLRENQLVVCRMVRQVTRGTRYEPKGRWLTYGQLDYILKTTGDPAYRALPAQANQQILKRIMRDYKSFFEALKVYKAQPELFTGKPKMPRYKKKGTAVTAVLTNQICRIKKEHYIRFPGTSEMLDLGRIPEGCRIKEVRIKPCHGEFFVEAVLEFPDDAVCGKGKLSGLDEKALREELKKAGTGDYRVAAIDPGVANFCAVVNNFGERPFLVKGNLIKSANRYYNKRLARLRSEADKCNGGAMTRRIRRLTDRRNRIIKDLMHKASRLITDWASARKADLVVLGHNVFQKQEIDIGHVNNQIFVQIPYSVFADMLRYKLEEKGIALLLTEESYTSMADFLAEDRIPVYGEEKKEKDEDGERPEPVFSGRRLGRHYVHFDGTRSNADINGAANILRKVFPNLTGWDRGVVDTPYAVRLA